MNGVDWPSSNLPDDKEESGPDDRFWAAPDSGDTDQSFPPLSVESEIQTPVSPFVSSLIDNEESMEESEPIRPVSYLDASPFQDNP
ncbi:MAG: hypothetical protein FWD55_07940, partial [Propionibacteriaceae bacterium]|nr:hypothetical protein [Propionibacteriaceae bacterium]